MKAFSPNAKKIIEQCIEGCTRPLYVIIDSHFIVKSCSGDFPYYGFDAIQPGQDCRDSLLFLVGLNTKESIQLGFIETPNGHAVNVNLFYEAGETILILLDATEQRMNHAAVQQKGNELALLQIEQTRLIESLRRLEKEVEAKRRLAEQASRLKGQFIATMSHEFRTPLTSILGYTTRLKQQFHQEPTSRNHLGNIERGAQHLLSLVENILDYSQIEADSLAISPIATDVSGVFDKLFSIFKSLAEDKQLELKMDIQSEIPEYLLLDEMRFRQVLVNLISNAIKFTEHGAIKVGVNYTRDNLSVFVKDTGIGIAEQDQQRIFNAFERSGKQQGTGLGLSIVKHLVIAMGGQLSLTSSLGKGSCFKVSIPVSKVIKSGKESNLRFMNDDKVKQKSVLESVLLVEDDPDIMTLIKGIFEDTKCQILEADNGLGAIDLTLSERPDLILLDINLPDMSGFDVLKTIRNHQFSKPVFVQSAWVSSEYKSRAKEAGCNEYLLKPLDIDYLNKLVSEYFYTPSDLGMPVERYQQLFQGFMEALPEKLEKLQQLEFAIIKQNWSALSRQELRGFAHKLAGSADLYGLSLIGKTSRQLDKLLREDNCKAIRNKISHKTALLSKQIKEVMTNGNAPA